VNYSLLALILLGALLGSGVGLVYTQHQSRQLFMELQALQVHRDELDIEWELLQLEESTLNTESVVDQTAHSRLNMLLPDPNSVVYVRR
jgi:cell division protein FtsL